MFGKSRNDVLKFSQRVAYGVGHIMNDICSAIWFSYTLLFFEVVLRIPSSLAGALMFVGQTADAVLSPFIGVLVDRFGTRKSWHMLGTALIAFSFSLIFSKCPWGPDSTSKTNQTDDNIGSSWDNASTTDIYLGALYYSVLITIFQAGWATVQISHLAIIPDMTPEKPQRDDLTAIRYTATVCASVFVYLVTWCILHVTGGDKESLGPRDLNKFKDLNLTGLLVGGICTMYFHAVLDTTNNETKLSKNFVLSGKKKWLLVIKDYLKSWPLYQVTLLYFTSRMIMNISLVYMPLYLVEFVGDKPEYIATVPLVSYISSFLASLGVRQIRSFCSSKIHYLIGSIVCIVSCVWIGIGLSHDQELFGVSALLGIYHSSAGMSITGVASLCLCSDLIGADTENGAFVYGVVTSIDKLLGGVVIILIENFKDGSFDHSSSYYRNVLTYGCGGFTIMGLLALFMTYCTPSKCVKNEMAQETTETVVPS